MIVAINPKLQRVPQPFKLLTEYDTITVPFPALRAPPRANGMPASEMQRNGTGLGRCGAVPLLERVV